MAVYELEDPPLLEQKSLPLWRKLLKLPREFPVTTSALLLFSALYLANPYLKAQVKKETVENVLNQLTPDQRQAHNLATSGIQQVNFPNTYLGKTISLLNSCNPKADTKTIKKYTEDKHFLKGYQFTHEESAHCLAIQVSTKVDGAVRIFGFLPLE